MKELLKRVAAKIFSWAEGVLSLLGHSEMPVWMTLLIAVSTGVATYLLAPAINAKFEVQKARSQYIMDNMKLLNADTAELFANIGKLDQEISDTKVASPQTIDELRAATCCCCCPNGRIGPARSVYRCGLSRPMSYPLSVNLTRIRKNPIYYWAIRA
jgi:hypothetical protein